MAAARTYFTAIKAGDTNIFKRAALGTDYQRDWMVAAYVRSSVAADKLQKSGTARFGRDETDKEFGEVLRSFAAGSAGLVGLTNAESSIDGTNATITFRPDSSGNAPDALKLQKRGGEWKVVLGDEINNADFDKSAMEATAEAVAQCAAEIDAGKYKTASAASQGMMSALMAKMQNQQHPNLPGKE